MEANPPPRRKLRGYPTAWKEDISALVDLIYQEDGLPKNNPDNCKGTAFHRAADIGTAWGIPTTAFDAHQWYYKTKK
jgi:hypothetical protein